MTSGLKTHPFPLYVSLDSGEKVYVSPNRLISREYAYYTINRDTAMELMMDRVRISRPEPESFIPLVAGEILNAMSFDFKEECLYIESRPEYDILIPSLAQVYIADHPLIGPEVTYQWPNGKISSISTTQSAFYSGSYWIMYVRHEEKQTPSATHHILQFSSEK